MIGSFEAVTSKDEQLMVRVLARDVVAFEQLYDQYAPEVMQFGLRLNLETAAAETLVEETFWAIWEQANEFAKLQIAFPVWLRRLARQATVNLRMVGPPEK